MWAVHFSTISEGGSGNRKRTHQKRADEAENRGVCSNAESERQDGDPCEDRSLAQGANTEANILREVFEKAQPAHIPAFLLLLLKAGKRAYGGLPSFRILMRKGCARIGILHKTLA